MLMEADAVSKVDAMWNLVLKSTALNSLEDCEKEAMRCIQAYFEEDAVQESFPPAAKPAETRLLSTDIRAFFSKFGESVKTPRQVARIFHGIPSPQFPALQWSQNGFWGRRRRCDFNEIIRSAKQVITSAHIIAPVTK